MLHPCAFVLYTELPITDAQLQLLADGYKIKYLEHDLTEERIAEVKFQLFHDPKGEDYAMVGSHVPVMVRTNGEVIRTSTGEKVGNIRKFLP